MTNDYIAVKITKLPHQDHQKADTFDFVAGYKVERVPRRDGQAELAWMASYIAHPYQLGSEYSVKPSCHPLYRHEQKSNMHYETGVFNLEEDNISETISVLK